MIVSGVKLKDEFLKPKTLVVTYLSDDQKEDERYTKWLRKRIKVLHYHESYVWNFYIQVLQFCNYQ